MFIKKYVKNSKTYFMLVVVEQLNRSEKPHFINCFITEQLAEVLIRLGVEVKNEKQKDK